MSQYNFLINGPVYDRGEYTVQNIMGGVIDIIRIVVTAICLIALTFLAIRYFMGTPTIKSEQKSELPDYIIGILIFLGVANFLPFLVEIIGSILAQI